MHSQWIVRDLPAASTEDLASDARRSLLEGWPLGRLVDIEAGATLAHAGGRCGHVWLIVEGRCGWWSTDANDRRRVVVELDAPCVVGLAEMLSSAPSAAEVRCLVEGRGLKVGADSLKTAIDEDARLSGRLLQLLAAHTLALGRAEAARHVDLETRMAMLLLDFAERYGRTTDDGLMIRHPLTEQTVADRLGSVPRSVRRVFAKWKRSGWVTRRRGWIVLDRTTSLSALVDR